MQQSRLAVRNSERQLYASRAPNLPYSYMPMTLYESSEIPARRCESITLLVKDCGLPALPWPPVEVLLPPPKAVVLPGR